MLLKLLIQVFSSLQTVFFFYENPSMQVTRSSGASVAKTLSPESRAHLFLVCYKGPRKSGRARNVSGMEETKTNARLAAAMAAVDAWKQHRGVSGVGEGRG